MVFGVGLDYFFSDESKRPVIAIVRKERVRFPDALDGGEFNCMLTGDLS
ncbi:MAG TPA: hypothetical protein VLV78_06445 [Thermoanaerobaculia bacterium]|nr:hypothetical protein [Thermoanaerobaculia bacterium]